MMGEYYNSDMDDVNGTRIVPARKVVKLNGETLTVVKSVYKYGVPCLRLVDSDGMPYATATTFIPHSGLGVGQTFIKDYSENTGMLAALVAAGVVRATEDYYESGFVRLPVVDVLI